MKPGIFLALILFLSVARLAAADLYESASVTPPALPCEFRGAWIATVANKDWPSAPGLSVAQQKAELISLLDTAVRLKMNTVVFQVRSSCDAMYESPYEPWSGYLTGVQGQAPQPFYDPLAFAIEEAHKRGLELHAWFNPFRARFNSALPYIAPNHISRTHPEWIRPYGPQLWLDPGEPAARQYVLSVIMDVVRRYDVDGVQLDDYFYPYPVENGKGFQLPFNDEASWARYGLHGGLSHEDWRRQNINVFVQSVYENIKAVKPWVKFGISPFGIWRPGNPPSVRGFDSYAELYSDSRLWLANGWLDYISPQLYWPINSPEHSFSVLLDWWAEQNVRHRNLWPGLAAYKTGPEFPASEMAREIQVTRAQAGASGEIFFELRNFEQNPSLADAVARQYSQPALVPASPWLGSSLLLKPRLGVQKNRGDWAFQWAAPVGHPAKWVLQYYEPDFTWHTMVLPGYENAQAFPDAPLIVSLRAMDRVGNLSAPAVIRRMGAANPPPPPDHPTGSFWGSYQNR